MLVHADEAKESAVYLAVTQQLKREGKWPPNNVTRIMGKVPYQYDDQSLAGFLTGVSDRLAESLPPFDFDFDEAFVVKGLGQSVAELIAAVTAKTT